MTSEQRVWAAINLQECDRVPVGFPLSWFAARHAGISMAEFADDCEVNAAASYKTFEDLGGIDVIPLVNFSPLIMNVAMPMKKKYPGRDLPPDSIMQMDEQEIMAADEYDIVISKGWAYYEKEYIFPRVNPEFADLSGKAMLQEKTEKVNRVTEKELRSYSDKGVLFFDGVMALPPFEMLSMARSFNPFLYDLYRRPDKIIAAMDVMLSESIDNALSRLKASRKLFGNTAISRSSCTFISPKIFEKFVFPYVRKIAEVFMSENLAMVFHLDQNWLKFLPYFRDLPEGRYVLELDGTTDIFEAKKIIGDRMCLMGDVPARLLKLGTAREVEEYCRKLIDIAGKGSGFILSAG